MAWDTAGSIINDAAIEIGLAPVADPYTSTDPNYIQMCGLLKSVGRELVHQRQWNHLRGEHTFTTVLGQSVYPLPDDYHNMIDQTWWNRTNRLPLGGPMSAQEWQYLKARLVGVVFTVLFRPMEGAITLHAGRVRHRLRVQLLVLGERSRHPYGAVRRSAHRV
jgi:hypothetical protein